MRGRRKRGRLVLAVAGCDGGAGCTHTRHDLELGGAEGRRRQHHRVAERHVRRCDARHDLPQVAGRDQGALREALSRLEGDVHADADQQRPVHGADRVGVRVEGSARRDARLLGRLHDAVHAELAAEAERSLVDKTPGFYESQSAWDLSCLNLNCKDGKGDIYAVPNDAGTYALFYNKALFKKAGVAEPPTTYKELLADCAKFKAKGILPLAYGDRDGYSTDNWVTYDYASYMAQGRHREGQRRQDEVRRPEAREAARGSSSSSSSRAASTPMRRRTRTTTRTRTSPPARPRWCRCSRS